MYRFDIQSYPLEGKAKKKEKQVSYKARRRTGKCVTAGFCSINSFVSLNILCQ